MVALTLARLVWLEPPSVLPVLLVEEEESEQVEDVEELAVVDVDDDNVVSETLRDGGCVDEKVPGVWLSAV